MRILSNLDSEGELVANQLVALTAMDKGLVSRILNALHKVFFAEEEHTTGNDHGHHGHGGAGESRWNLPPITWPEVTAALILMALLVIVGLYPSIMLDMIQPNVELFLKGVTLQ